MEGRKTALIISAPILSTLLKLLIRKGYAGAEAHSVLHERKRYLEALVEIADELVTLLPLWQLVLP